MKNRPFYQVRKKRNLTTKLKTEKNNFMHFTQGIVLGAKRQNINTILKDLKEENISLKD